MDPCPFVRLTVANLALTVPVASRPAYSAVHPSSSPFFCKIELRNFPHQSAAVPYIAPEKTQFMDGNSLTNDVVFHLSKSDLDRVKSKSSLFSTSEKPQLKISVYSGRRGATCGVSNSGCLLGRISLQLDLTEAETKTVIFHNGWIKVGKEANSKAQLHLKVAAEPDPRFVFQFDGAPECSPQVFQIRGTTRQPVFTCKFTLRVADHNQISRERGKLVKERKGWSITIHDLSGSPVAAASMVTPFVASPGSDRVSRSNPGCWLILRPGQATWTPWGRLEAWRERGSFDGLGYKFELIPDSASSGVVLAESTISCFKGGKFTVDLNSIGITTLATPYSSPQSNRDFVSKGFVASATVGGEWKTVAPTVELGVQQVNCTEDAAVFVALAAAVDLSIDAASLFSRKLPKELCPPTPDLPL